MTCKYSNTLMLEERIKGITAVASYYFKVYSFHNVNRGKPWRGPLTVLQETECFDMLNSQLVSNGIIIASIIY